MKTPTLIITSLSLFSGLSYGQEWLNEIVQTTMVESEEGGMVPVVKLMEVPSQGSASSIDPVPTDGSRFELIVTNLETGAETMVDVADIDASTPSAKITIDSGDSYAGVARVRADKPFTVSTTYSGILAAGVGVDSKATEVEWRHKSQNTVVTNVNENTVEIKKVFKNDPDSKAFNVTNIQPANGESTTELKGIETFSVVLPHDDSAPLDEAILHVYPKPTGKFLKFGEHTPGSGTGENGAIVIINNVPRNIQFEVENLYPGGSVYVEVDVVREGVTVPTGNEVTATDETNEGDAVDPVNAPSDILWHYNVPTDITPSDADRSAEITFTEVFQLTTANFAIQHEDKLTFKLVMEDPCGKEVLHSFDVDADLLISFNGNATSSE